MKKNTTVQKEEVEAGLKFEKGNTSTGTTMSYLARAALNDVISQYMEEKRHGL